MELRCGQAVQPSRLLAEQAPDVKCAWVLDQAVGALIVGMRLRVTSMQVRGYPRRESKVSWQRQVGSYGVEEWPALLRHRADGSEQKQAAAQCKGARDG